jgi:hypothetical protein
VAVENYGVHEAIALAAAETNAGLVVMATDGRAGILRAVVGSVAGRAVRRRGRSSIPDIEVGQPAQSTSATQRLWTMTRSTRACCTTAAGWCAPQGKSTAPGYPVGQSLNHPRGCGE